MRKTRLEMLNPDKGEVRREMTREERIVDGLEVCGDGLILDKDAVLLPFSYQIEAKDGIAALEKKIDEIKKVRAAGKDEDKFFLIIRNIDQADEGTREEYRYLIKREGEYASLIPKNTVLVFTIETPDLARKLEWRFHHLLSIWYNI